MNLTTKKVLTIALMAISLSSHATNMSQKQLTCGHRFGGFKAEHSDYSLTLEVSQYNRGYLYNDQDEVLGQKKSVNSTIVELNLVKNVSNTDGVIVATLDIAGNPTIKITKTEHEIVLDSSDQSTLDTITKILGLKKSRYSCLEGLD
jgi:hypothetical protein